jgi:transcriptional regulator
MYIPKFNQTTDKDEIVSFMRQFSFATIITAKNSFPIATHLPFVVTEKDENVILTSHFAKANPQWADIENNQVLIIFSEPHAYISPKNYEKELNVPTWNYISVHAYGKASLVSETHEIFDLLEATIDNYETSYKSQWESLPDDYKMKMANGIVAFNIFVTDLQAKKKLSQNRTETEQQNIIDTLSKSCDTNEQKIAEFMKKNDSST